MHTLTWSTTVSINRPCFYTPSQPRLSVETVRSSGWTGTPSLPFPALVVSSIDRSNLEKAMRTRNQSKRHNQSTGEQVMEPVEGSNSLESLNEDGTLTAISHEAVGKLLKRVNARGLSALKKQDNYLRQCDLASKSESLSEKTDEHGVAKRNKENALDGAGCSSDAIQSTPSKDTVEGKAFHHTNPDSEEELDESFWEDGSLHILNSVNNFQKDLVNGVTIEFEGTPDSGKRKTIRRASAEDKELAELVHKVHLLCLLGRGRLIDNACNDPLIQASLLSLLPKHLLRISEVTKLTVNALAPLVSWFHNNFHIRSPSSTERSFHSALAFALETREGTAEEVAALSVALFRALNLTTRFVSILDVASLKPDTDKSESVRNDASKAGKGIFHSSTLMVARPNQVSISPVKQSSSDDKGNICETSSRGACRAKNSKSSRNSSQSKDTPIADQSTLASEEPNELSDMCLTKKSKEESKRKGDLEFEMQLEMALSTTAVGTSRSSMILDANDIHNNSENLSSPAKRMKTIKTVESPSSQGISTAFGSRKVGAPLYWAEVYCSGENLTGKWVHVDAVNAIIDGEQKVEPAAAACKTSLRYAVAFAGLGAKDVTRRYCMKWYKIASQRVDPIWWGTILAPLKELESGATGGVIHLEQDDSNGQEKVGAFKISDSLGQNCILADAAILPGQLAMEVPKEACKKLGAESPARNPIIASRSSLEDMDLETRALTEPLPTNQQAYKTHHLYALERWLNKYQILHPKGPILGFCSGHPVYPRTCVQILHTKQRWLREGLQVKANELPAKVLKRSLKLSKAQTSEADDHGEEGCEGNIVLYGKWQTEPLCLPHAVNGIVPKNERGQVDVWSEKCLPPGTVHLRLPRVAPVAKRLDIDFAPAMVGFEFRNGRSLPVFEGIVVCAEFKDAVLEAYAEEEERREAEEKKRSEAQAILRWYQLLSSIVTRQRLNNCYGDGLASQTCNDIPQTNDKVSAQVGCSEDDRHSPGCLELNVLDRKLDVKSMVPTEEEHEHAFLTDDQAFDEESFTRTKRCRCGFSIQVEEM
ncbi:DNA repair protein RAD4 [Camellia sinensis]|uniref:DNA repair protein RAD4 n=1 Tax=Camellia sinensis TaxID=4442 RepID=UPI0010364884|nr:DNA repair protein RAD4 [Camellia sinensis]